MPETRPDWRPVIRARLEAPLSPDVIEEIAEHLDEVYRLALAAGRTAADARLDVERELETLPAFTRAAARLRTDRQSALILPPAAGRRTPIRSFLRDLKYATRLLFAAPSFSLLVILTLALGVGANTAVFSIVHALYLAPLPFPESDRLVMTWEYEVEDPASPFIVSMPNWKDWSRESTAFQQTAIWELLRINVSGDGEAEQFPGMRVSASLFPMLGIRPLLGRTFTDTEDAPGHNVVVIGHNLWRSRYGADPSVIGRTVRVNGIPREIIGVMPREFIFEHHLAQVWVPIAFNENDADRDSHSFRSAARLRPGVSFENAKAELDAIGKRLAERYPDENRGESATLTRMSDLGVSFMRPTILTIFGAVGLVLLIACVNIANLLLARAGARGREFGIRSALGAGRGRLASQLLAEGLVLAIAGGVAGVALAIAGTAVLADVVPAWIRFAPFRQVDTTPLHPPVLLFTFVAAILTGVLFSIAPLATVAGEAPSGALRAGGERGVSTRTSAIRTALVGLEVSLAIIVLAGAGLMIKSIDRLLRVDPGLDPAGVVVMNLALPQPDFYGPAVRSQFCGDLDREVSKLPGVVHAGAISHLPFSGANAGRGIVVEGRPVPTPDDVAGASYRVTCPGYFAAVGIPILAGRDFTHADTMQATGAVIINEALAREFWPGQDPLGRRIQQGVAGDDLPWLTVIGIVGDVRHFGLDARIRGEMYRPYPQAAWPNMTITIKTERDPLAVVSSVRSALRRIDPDGAVTGVRSMDEVVGESIGNRRFPMLLLSLFSLIALALAMIGVYGVVSYVVSLRTREIGIRMALGAEPGAVVRMVVRRSLVPIVVGLGVGITGALFTSSLLSALLYEVKPHDPAVLGMIAFLLGTSALVASFIPARRAASVDPIRVLKQE